MAGSRNGRSGSSDSARISEELFDAFNMDDYDEGASRRKSPAKAAASRPERTAPEREEKPARRERTSSARQVPAQRSERSERPAETVMKRNEGRPAQGARKRPRRKAKKKVLMIGAIALAAAFLLFLIIGVAALHFSFVPTFFIFLFDVAIGFLLAPVIIFAPIIFIVIQLIAGFFTGHLLVAVLGALLLAGAQVILFLLK